VKVFLGISFKKQKTNSLGIAIRPSIGTGMINRFYSYFE